LVNITGIHTSNARIIATGMRQMPNSLLRKKTSSEKCRFSASSHAHFNAQIQKKREVSIRMDTSRFFMKSALFDRSNFATAEICADNRQIDGRSQI